MRILHISPFYYPSIGGLERFCEDIAKRAFNLNNEVHILTQSVKGKSNYEEIDGLKIHRVRPLIKYSKALIIPNIQKKIDEINPDVIHIQGPAPGMVDFIKKRNGTRLLMTCHNDLSLTDAPAYKFLAIAYRILAFPRVIAKLDKVILLSESFKHHSKLFASIPPDKMTIIQNAVDLERFSPGHRSKIDYKKDVDIKSKFLAIFVASMEPKHLYKGVEYLLRSIVLLKNLDVTFCLIGEGELKNNYVEMASHLGISERVRFAGRIDDELLVAYYRAADLFVLPSTSVEFMPLVMIEAMACGTPVITTRIHGPMEMIREGYNGYLINPRDPEQLAGAIDNFFSDESAMRQMQLNSRYEAEEKYSWDVVMGRYLEEYAQRETRLS